MGNDSHPLSRTSTGPGPAVRGGVGVCRSPREVLCGLGKGSARSEFSRQLELFRAVLKVRIVYGCSLSLRKLLVV